MATQKEVDVPVMSRKQLLEDSLNHAVLRVENAKLELRNAQKLERQLRKELAAHSPELL